MPARCFATGFMAPRSFQLFETILHSYTVHEQPQQNHPESIGVKDLAVKLQEPVHATATVQDPVCQPDAGEQHRPFGDGESGTPLKLALSEVVGFSPPQLGELRILVFLHPFATSAGDRRACTESRSIL